MAYFACATAAKTGTDSATRKSIAKGTTSATFTNKVTGKQTLRGVVQLDLVGGRDVGYVTGMTIADRIRSATGKSTSNANAARKSVSTAPKAYITNLHNDPTPGVIKTSTTLSLSKKKIVGIFLAVGIIGYLVMR